MPFALIIIGLVLIIASARGKLKDLGELLKGDFTGKNNFFVWLIALGVVGTIGYYKPAEKASRAFLVLILIAMILRNGGFFEKFVAALTELTSEGGEGSGPVGNTLDGQSAPVTRGNGGDTSKFPGKMKDDNVGRPAITTLEAQGLAKLGNMGGLKTVAAVASNPIGAVRSVAKSIPIIGGFF